MKIKVYLKVIASFVFGALCTQGHAQSPAVVQSADFSYSLKLTELSFSGNGIVPIRNDNNTTFYDAPHWQATNQKPVCYVSGTKPQITCSFEIDGICTNILYVRGKTSNGIEFTQKQLSIQSNIATYPLTEANSGFEANKADLLENFSIVWEMSDNPNGQWVNIGTSRNIMYVVKKEPKRIQSTGNKRSGDNNYATFRTILHIGCQYGQGEVLDKSVIDKVYGYFKLKNVRSIENNLCMQYWGDQIGDGFATNVPVWVNYPLGLIKYGDGYCQAWAEFFVEIMRTQGIGELKLKGIIWKTDWKLDADNRAQLTADLLRNNLQVNPNLNMNNLIANFYIKKWAHQATFVEDNINYTPGQSIASGDQDGLAAQCMNNPWSIFPNHLIVEYENFLYDPSYGSAAVSDKATWQMNNIAYFGTRVRVKERDDTPSAPYRSYYWFRSVNNEAIPDLENVDYPYN